MQVPDLEVIVHTNDSPLVPETATAKDQPAPPIFGYTTAAGYADVPFPDFSYWGHEHGRLVGAQIPEFTTLTPGLHEVYTLQEFKCQPAPDMRSQPEHYCAAQQHCICHNSRSSSLM